MGKALSITHMFPYLPALPRDNRKLVRYMKSLPLLAIGYLIHISIYLFTGPARIGTAQVVSHSFRPLPECSVLVEYTGS